MTMPSRSKPQNTQQDRFLTSIAERLGIANTPLGLLALVPLFLWLLVAWSQTVASDIHSYDPLPVWDYWRVIQYFPQYQAFDWSVLWIQHNEHRILFPEMIFAADALLFHGREILPQVTSLLCYFFVWFVLAAAFYSEETINRLVCTASILLAGGIIAWQGSLVVVASPFLLQWTMLQLSVTIALYVLGEGVRRQQWLHVLGVIVCGIVATYSSGNGMLVWPVLILGALLLRMPKVQLTILVIAAILSITTYFVGYKSSNDLNVMAMLHHPIYLAGFVVSYLSMPFGAIGNATFALIVGSCNLLMFLFLLRAARRNHLLRNNLSVLLFGSYFFTLLTAVLTAAGRMNPMDHQFIAAKAARYVTLPLVNWAVLLLAVIWLSSVRKWVIFSAGNLVFIASMMFLALFHKLEPWLQGNNAVVADQQWATLSVEAGLFDPSLVVKLFPDPGFVRSHLSTLQQNHLSIYWNQPEATWVGHLAKAEFPGAWTQNLSGAVGQIYPINGGAELAGTRPNLKPGEKLVLVDNNGYIVGLGAKLSAGVPTILASGPGNATQGWVGFLNTNYGSKEFSVYIVKGRTLTRITNALAVPQLKEAGATDIGAPISNVIWQASQWKLAILPAGIETGNDYRGSFWSSWNGADASTGQISSSVIPVPANHCLILPILHGPSVQGLSAQIVNAQTDQTVAGIPMQNSETQWKLWRVPIDSKVNSIKIVARDAGTGWGQWLAIGDPLQCR